MEGAGIDPTAPNAPMFRLLQDRLEQVEADVQLLQFEMGAVTLANSETKKGVASVVARCDVMQGTAGGITFI